MAWNKFQDCTGQTWAVERDALCALIRANARAATIRKRASYKVENNVFTADLHTVQVDWKGMDEEIDQQAKIWWHETEQRLKHLPAQKVFSDVVGLRQETIAKTAEFHYMQREASRITSQNIAGMDKFWDRMITGAEVTRDLSAGTIMVGCTILSGGAAGGAMMAATGAGTAAGATASAGVVTGFLAVGSTLKGVAKYQDLGKDGVKMEGRIGSAVIEGVGNFGIGMIGLGAGAAGAGEGAKTALVFVTATIDAGLEGAKATIEGQSGKEALIKASTKLVTGSISGLGGNILGPMFDKMPLIANVGINTGLNLFVDKGTGAIADFGVKAFSPTASEPKLGALPSASGTLTFAPTVSGLMGAGNAHEDYVRQHVLRRAA